MSPLLEDSYSTTRTIDGQSYFLSLTDTAGQEEYRGLWAASNLKSDAFLLVYDITTASSLSTLDYFMQMIDIECDTRQDAGAVQPVKIVAGNKCDLKERRVVSSRQGLEYARSRGCGFMETSAREIVNIEETFARESALPSFANRGNFGCVRSRINASQSLSTFTHCVLSSHCPSRCRCSSRSCQRHRNGNRTEAKCAF
jgi:small GTP-binding protein